MQRLANCGATVCRVTAGSDSAFLTLDRAKRRSANPKKTNTVVAAFRQSLDLLMQRMQRCQPHFIRCFKPNDKKLAALYGLSLAF